jgi:ADP-heptose:LPS heptosyltransferase
MKVFHQARAWLGLALQWRLGQARRKVNGWLVRRGARVFIAAHWPWPRRKPFQRSRLRLSGGGGGIGDELMCTPIFAEIKRRNPDCHITFVSRRADFFRGHPHLDEVEPLEYGKTTDVILLDYAYTIPPPRPLVTLMAECVGLRMEASRLIPPPLRPPQDDLKRFVAGTLRPRVVIQPLASQWAPNKLWPLENWAALIRQLVEEFEVIEVGTERAFAHFDFGDHFHSFAGATDMDGFVYLIGSADAFVGPVSGGMHLANALGIPSVIIFGGYESPAGFDYQNLEAFYTPVECAPCWLKDGCPYGLKCLHAISPAAVRDAVGRAVQKGNRG